MKISTHFERRDGRRQLAEGLAHQPSLNPDRRVADIPFHFRSRHEGGDRVDHDHIHGAGFDQIFSNLKGFLGRSRLADQEVFNLHAELLTPGGVKSMLNIDERRDPADPLGIGHRVEGDRGLAAGFGAKKLDDSTARQPLAAQGQIQR